MIRSPFRNHSKVTFGSSLLAVSVLRKSLHVVKSSINDTLNGSEIVTVIVSVTVQGPKDMIRS